MFIKLYTTTILTGIGILGKKLSELIVVKEVYYTKYYDHLNGD